MKLRGKKILRKPVDKDYTKIPNELFGLKMNPIDKLVLMRLHYHREDYILAYTRLAQELAISKTTIKESWKRLKRDGYIVEQGEYYRINLNGTGNDPKNIGTASGPKGNQGTGTDHGKVRDMDYTGSASGPRKVRETTLIGTGDVPNEEDKTKEEKELNKNKEEPLVVGVGGKVSDSATHPSGVAPSSPHQTQLSDEKKKTSSKYTSNENERLILLNGFSDYLNHNPNSKLVFSSYEDILMLTVYGLEDNTNDFIITKWREIISLLTLSGNIQHYNTHINNYAEKFIDNIENSQGVLKQLRQQLIASN